jgi:F-type H+-transporting ATPase subunit epsilon
MHSFPLTISAVDSIRYQGEADSVTLPGADGVLTVLKGHEALITPLKKGVILVKKAGEEFSYEIESGVLEVSPKGVTVLI